MRCHHSTTFFALLPLMALFLAVSLPASAQGKPDLIRMLGQDVCIHSIAYSPDGKLLATASGFVGGGDNSVKIWRVSDGMLLRSFFLNGEATKVSFTPDGKAVMAADNTNTITFWRVADGTLIQAITGISGNITRNGGTVSGYDNCGPAPVALSPDGSLVATGSDNGNIQLWRVSDGKNLFTMPASTEPINTIAFSPDGQMLASGPYDINGNDPTVKLWHIPDGAFMGSFATGVFYLQYLCAFSPVSPYSDSYLLGVGNMNNQVQLWRVKKDGTFPTQLFTIGKSGYMHDLAFSKDGQSLGVVGENISGVSGVIYRVSDGTIVSQTSANYLDAIAFDPSGQSFATGSTVYGSGIILGIWRTSDGSLINSLASSPSEEESILSLAVSPDGKTMAYNGGRGNLLLRRVSDGAMLQSIPNFFITGITFSSDSALVAASLNYRNFGIWRVSDGTLLQQFNANSYQTGAVALSPDGKLLAGSSQAGVTIFRVSDGTLVKTIQDSANGGCMLFSPDGSLLYVQNDVYRTTDWTLIRSFPTSIRIESVSLSPDSQTLALGGRTTYTGYGVVKLWNVSNTSLLHSIPIDSYSNGFTSLSFSPDGQVLAVGTVYPHLQFYLVSDGTLLRSYDLEIGQSFAGFYGVPLAYTTDGKEVIYGRSDGSVCAVLNPYRNAVFPSRGGNTGNVTVRLVSPDTLPLPSSAQMKLSAVGQADITGQNTSVINDHLMQTTFNLAGAPIGLRDLVVLSAGTPILTYPQGFTIEQGTEPQMWVDIVGPLYIGAGLPATYTLFYGNSGNVDEYHANAGVAFPNYMSWTTASGLGPILSGQTSDGYTFFAVDRVNIPAEGAGSVTFQITAPTNSSPHQQFQIAAFDPIESEVRAEFWANGIWAYPPCSLNQLDPACPPNTDECPKKANVGGLHQSTIDGLIAFKNDMEAALGFQEPPGTFFITGGTECGGHMVTNGYDHAHGYKVDLSPFSDLTMFITQSGYCHRIQDRECGNQQWDSPSGAIFCFEQMKQVKVNGAKTCVATAPHWDMQFPPFSTQAIITAMAGNGTGSVSSKPLGYWPTLNDISNDFAGLFTANTSPTLYATSDSPYTFCGWTGDLSGTDTTLYVPLSNFWPNDVNLVATFSDDCSGNGESGDGSGGAHGGWGGSGGGNQGLQPGTLPPGLPTLYGGILVNGDPNDIAGPVGYGTAQWIPTRLPVRYTIFFENEPTATRPVQQIIITDHLDPVALDATTVNLGNIWFQTLAGDQQLNPTEVYSPPVGTRQFTAQVDLRPAQNLLVDVTASLDMLTGDLTWTFQSIDPSTGKPSLMLASDFSSRGQWESRLHPKTQAGCDNWNSYKQLSDHHI